MQKDYSWNHSTSICDNGKDLKSIADTLPIVCDKILYVFDTVSTKMASAVATNAASSVSINFSNKKLILVAIFCKQFY